MVQMASFNSLDICLWTFSTKVIPRIKNIDGMEHFPLRCHTVTPDTLYQWKIINVKQMVYIFYI